MNSIDIAMQHELAWDIVDWANEDYEIKLLIQAWCGIRNKEVEPANKYIKFVDERLTKSLFRLNWGWIFR
jgi:hypothetical protein